MGMTTLLIFRNVPDCPELVSTFTNQRSSERPTLLRVRLVRVTFGFGRIFFDEPLSRTVSCSPLAEVKASRFRGDETRLLLWQKSETRQKRGKTQEKVQKEEVGNKIQEQFRRVLLLPCTRPIRSKEGVSQLYELVMSIFRDAKMYGQPPIWSSQPRSHPQASSNPS